MIRMRKVQSMYRRRFSRFSLAKVMRSKYICLISLYLPLKYLLYLFIHLFIYVFIYFLSRYTDIDEFTSQTHDCSPNSKCTNMEGSFQCECKSGFTGDGKTCDG